MPQDRGRLRLQRLTRSVCGEAPVPRVRCAQTAASAPGRATAEGTAAFCARRPLGRAAARALGATGLSVAPVGFGCHRLEDTEEHRSALRGAIRCGCNLVDVAPGYSDGAAEAAVGGVLRGMFEAGELRREEVVVVTKVGNVVGSALASPTLAKMGGVARVREDVWHCIEPAWIEEELTRSLERLGLACVDCLLLHCPEFASRAAGVSMDAVYERVGRAVEHLELEVARGRAARYGVSAAFYPLRASEPEHLSLGRLLGLLPAGHHLAVLQLPLNFAEPDALLAPHDGAAPLLKSLADHRLGVLTNRPLDGLFRDLPGVLRFASEGPLDGQLLEEDADALEGRITALCGSALGDPEEPVAGELAGKTVHVLVSLAGVQCVLVGMRRPRYVVDVVKALKQRPLLEPAMALAAVKSAHTALSMWFSTADGGRR